MTRTAAAPPDVYDDATQQEHAAELARGERYAFGANWKRFLENMSEERAKEAVISLQKMLGVENLNGKTFLDIGSGSGLFSLAANRMGAKVTSFDFDTDSVECTAVLRKRYAASGDWKVMQGSVLDRAFLATLGTFDIVYSWGVLHHTGAMWDAIWNAESLVAPRGTFFIAIYNDQGAWSSRWKKIKRFYCSGIVGKTLVSSTFIPYWLLRNFAADVVWMRDPTKRYREYGKHRGMSVVRDWHDWLGGYPFEVARPEEIVMAVTKKGYRLANLVTVGGSVGCVQYVFTREDS